jgi:hypothetical protein
MLARLQSEFDERGPQGAGLLVKVPVTSRDEVRLLPAMGLGRTVAVNLGNQPVKVRNMAGAVIDVAVRRWRLHADGMVHQSPCREHAKTHPRAEVAPLRGTCQNIT